MLIIHYFIKYLLNITHCIVWLGYVSEQNKDPLKEKAIKTNAYEI